MADETKFYAVTHQLTGESKTTIVEATSQAKARAHIEQNLVQVRRATAKELVDCGGEYEKAGDEA